jgi:hypothetical protein
MEEHSMNKASRPRGLPDEDRKRFDTVRDRAKELSVLDINFSGVESDSLECYERALDIIERHKERFDRNAGEVGV